MELQEMAEDSRRSRAESEPLKQEAAVLRQNARRWSRRAQHAVAHALEVSLSGPKS
jgi:hypothetical protein